MQNNEKDINWRVKDARVAISVSHILRCHVRRTRNIETMKTLLVRTTFDA